MGGECDGVDYAGQLQSFVKGNTLQLGPTGMRFNGYRDPCPGSTKQLDITYTCV